MKLSAPIFRLKRQAKLLSRETNAPLHASLDEVAKREGYRGWSHLASSSSHDRPAPKLLAHFVPGDLVLLGARPGHGKTLLGVELAVEAARAGHRSFFFSLEETESSISNRLQGLGFDMDETGNALVIDTSDAICADYIIERVGHGQDDSVVVVDYLQLLDQRRRNPELAVQVKTLAGFACTASTIIVAISQINRSFDMEGKPLPNLSNVRLPNPVDLALFTKTCFLHNGEMRVDAVN
ncbi:DNA helicase [Methylobacterium sp. AMS5]|uniref:DNA helicase n=1 Tax=Methylobacterium sp. AMS5 TaxID=925818 RepID=UPI00074FA62F|nr:DNA helicase [Methylobacterium sp. AMS5]AMB44359.1 Replicative DNA helicase [Methylobacterium sp. AMS5]